MRVLRARRDPVVRKRGWTLSRARLRSLPEIPEGVRRAGRAAAGFTGVDTIATLPLDAAAIQQGYDG